MFEIGDVVTVNTEHRRMYRELHGIVGEVVEVHETANGRVYYIVRLPKGTDIHMNPFPFLEKELLNLNKEPDWSV